MSVPHDLRFEPADPRRAPAAALLAAMTEEMAALYGQADRLDRPALDPADLCAPRGSYLIGWIGDVVVAGGGVRRLAPGLAEVKRMYVTPAHRGRGLAGALLGALEDQAADLGCSAVRLDTGPLQPRALTLYRRAGYRAIDPYNDNPYAVFWGEKALAGGPGS